MSNCKLQVSNFWNEFSRRVKINTSVLVLNEPCRENTWRSGIYLHVLLISPLGEGVWSAPHDMAALTPGKEIPVAFEQEVGPRARSVGCEGQNLVALEGGAPARSLIAKLAYAMFQRCSNP